MIDKLPAPRLQLHWRRPTDDENRDRQCDWICVYELVLPLSQAGDIRRTADRQEIPIEISKTFVSTSRMPTYAPFRDGVHAKWDSAALGGIPIYVIDPDGDARQECEP